MNATSIKMFQKYLNYVTVQRLERKHKNVSIISVTYIYDWKPISRPYVISSKQLLMTMLVVVGVHKSMSLLTLKVYLRVWLTKLLGYTYEFQPFLTWHY